jgi:hypothetical protein
METDTGRTVIGMGAALQLITRDWNERVTDCI